MQLKDFRPMMERCSNCLGCKWIPFDKVRSMRFGENCPSVCYSNFNTYAARGRFQLGQIILDEDAPYSETVKEIVHQCNACGACDVSCKVCRYNLEPLEHNIALKTDAVQKGHTLPEAEAVINVLKNEKAMVPDAKKASRLDWAEGLGLKDINNEKADALFFAGCKYSYDENLKGTARAWAELLFKLGADIGLLGNAEMCCGGRARQMGYENEFEAQADANIKLIKSRGIKTIITPCSDCYHTFKRLYAAKGLDIEVLHAVEYLSRLIDEGKVTFKNKVDLTVTYHDPCHLGRQGEKYVPWEGKEKKILNQIHTWEPRRPRYAGAEGIYDAPRNIISAIPGTMLVEMERIREYSWCCGAGGGCSVTYHDFSEWTAGERITEAVASGAHALITACPWCKSNFNGVCDENGKTIEVMDIIELVNKAL